MNKTQTVSFVWALLFSIVVATMQNQAQAFASSATPNDAGSSSNNSNPPDETTPKLLPPPNDTGDESIPVLKMGDTIRFERMGPIIINTDGSTRRIANWDTMTEQEKEVTWRRISKRNEERRKKLLLKEQQQASTDAPEENPPSETEL